jgi:hypothetical protein
VDNIEMDPLSPPIPCMALPIPCRHGGSRAGGEAANKVFERGRQIDLAEALDLLISNTSSLICGLVATIVF